MPLRRLALTLLAAAGVLMAACSDAEEEPPASTATPTAAATREATPETTPTPTAAPVTGVAALLPTVDDLPPGAWTQQDVAVSPEDVEVSGNLASSVSEACALPGAPADDFATPPADDALARVFTLEEADRFITLAVTSIEYPSTEDTTAIAARLTEAWADETRWADDFHACLIREGFLETLPDPAAAAGLAVEDVVATRSVVEGQAWVASIAADISLPEPSAPGGVVTFELRTDTFTAVVDQYAFTMLASAVLSEGATPLLFDPAALLAIFRENVAALP